MKTALFLIPRIFKSINKQAYYDACKRKVKEEGFITINIPFYEDFIKSITTSYIQEVEPCIESIFVFTDFGLDRFIDSIRIKYSDKIIYKKFSNEEMNLFKDTPQSIFEEAVIRTRGYFGYEISIDKLKKKTRVREIVLTRYFFFKKMKEKTKLSLQQIGNIVGKEHATVLHGIKRVDNEVGLLDEYKIFWGELKRNDKKITKDEKSIISEMELRKISNVFESPFANLKPSNNREYSGYREHSL